MKVGDGARLGGGDLKFSPSSQREMRHKEGE